MTGVVVYTRDMSNKDILTAKRKELQVELEAEIVSVKQTNDMAEDSFKRGSTVQAMMFNAQSRASIRRIDDLLATIFNLDVAISHA